MSEVNNALPKWLAVSLESATVTLSVPSEINGVKADRITMRSPTVRDERTARKVAGNDDAQYEMELIASLAQCGVNDLEALQRRDYTRLQVAFLRLEDVDGVDPRAS